MTLIGLALIFLGFVLLFNTDLDDVAGVLTSVALTLAGSAILRYATTL